MIPGNIQLETCLVSRKAAKVIEGMGIELRVLHVQSEFKVGGSKGI